MGESQQEGTQGAPQPQAPPDVEQTGDAPKSEGEGTQSTAE